MKKLKLYHCLFFILTAVLFLVLSLNCEIEDPTPTPTPTTTVTPTPTPSPTCSPCVTGAVGGVKGFVRDESGNVLAGTEISIEDRSVLSEVDGSFILNDIPAGDCNINAKTSNYQDYTDGVVVKEGGVVTKDIIMIPD